MYEDGQLETELRVLRKVMRALTKVNRDLSTIKVPRTSLVVAYAELQQELTRREGMMKQYKATGEF